MIELRYLTEVREVIDPMDGPSRMSVTVLQYRNVFKEKYISGLDSGGFVIYSENNETTEWKDVPFVNGESK